MVDIQVFSAAFFQHCLLNCHINVLRGKSLLCEEGHCVNLSVPATFACILLYLPCFPLSKKCRDSPSSLSSFLPSFRPANSNEVPLLQIPGPIIPLSPVRPCWPLSLHSISYYSDRGLLGAPQHTHTLKAGYSCAEIAHTREPHYIFHRGQWEPEVLAWHTVSHPAALMNRDRDSSVPGGRNSRWFGFSNCL